MKITCSICSNPRAGVGGVVVGAAGSGTSGAGREVARVQATAAIVARRTAAATRRRRPSMSRRMVRRRGYAPRVMPVIHVRAAPFDRGDASAALQAIATAVADAVPCDVGDVWCTFSTVDVQSVGTETRDGVGRIVYVDLWIRPREDAAAAPRALEAACRAAAEAIGLPVEDVWGTLRPIEAGSVFAGGSLLAD